MVGGIDWSRSQFNNAVKAQRPARLDGQAAAARRRVRGRAEAGQPGRSTCPITANWPDNGQLGYRGETSLKEAIASSRNAAAVRLTREARPARGRDVGRRLGIDPGPSPDSAFVLGTVATNPLSMTAAYAAVANGGYQSRRAGVLAIVDGRGEVRVDFLDDVRGPGSCRSIASSRRELLWRKCPKGTGRTPRLSRRESLRQDRDVDRKC